jgi:serine/threonine protein kinase
MRASGEDLGLAPPPGTKGKARHGEDGTPYLVMELLEGRVLEEEVDRGRLGVGRSLAIARQLLSALAYAHDQGVVHGDLKAGNLWLTDSIGRPDHLKVLDFGLARIVDPNDGRGGAVVSGRALTQRTELGTLTSPRGENQTVPAGEGNGSCACLPAYPPSARLWERGGDRFPRGSCQRSSARGCARGG